MPCPGAGVRPPQTLCFFAAPEENRRGHGSVMRRPRSRRDGAVKRPSASGRTYPQLAQIVRMLCAVAGRRFQRLAAAVAVSHRSCSPSPRSSRAHPVRPVAGLSFIRVRLRSAPGPLAGLLLVPLAGLPERGHPGGLATDVEPAQDEVEGACHHGLGVLIALEAAAAGDDVVVQLPGRMVFAQPGQRADELEGGVQLVREARS